MTFFLSLSPLAKSDLCTIAQYTLEKWGDSQADIYLDKFDKALLKIQENPYIGRLRTDVSDRHRCLIFEKHLIIYTIQENDIMISRIMHHSIDVKSMFIESG